MVDIPWDQSKWIVISSGFFLFPAYSFYRCNQYVLSSGLVLTSLVSMNYWRHVDFHSWRRTCDLIWAKIAFVIYMTTGFHSVYVNGETLENICSYLPLTAVTVGNYIMACRLAEKNMQNNDWVVLHVLFHVLLAVQMQNVVNVVCYSRNICSSP